ncbi:MAG: DNA replication/repair protein RecF [Clostridiales bacterium]|nr:DNA replication/repair protein RecF [Clostridiales bacterium]
MKIRSIELKNFRNYGSLDINFDGGTNILYGDNAQGKTNILEAAYVSGTTKSHRGSKDREMIRFDEEEAHIRTVVEKNEREYQIDMHLRRRGSKGVAVNKIPIKRASELFGILNIVFFSPEDLNIIKDGPSERRRFMDLELSQLDKLYLSDLAAYNKVLNQRNRLLKDLVYQKELIGTLPAWDEQLIKYGKRIIEKRSDFIRSLDMMISDIHRKISGGREELFLSYEKNVEKAEFEAAVREVREKDMRLCQTTVGPHRDDIRFTVDGIDIRKYGSQGQQRTAALSLKLSEIELVKKLIHSTPVLLLDDVLSELDSSRQNYLLGSIENIQTIITCTGLEEFVKNRFPVDKVFLVKEGNVTEAINSMMSTGGGTDDE